MRSSFSRHTVSALALGISLIAISELSQAQAQPQIPHQTLDRVDVFNSTAVLEMTFNDPNRTRDFVNLGIAGTDFVSCKLTAIDGIFCLDSEVIQHWPKPEEPQTFVDELNCDDPALNGDAGKTDTCVGMTVALSGAILISLRKAANNYSLMKIVAKPASSACPGGWSVLAGSLYCARELYAGRPRLLDIDPIDVDLAPFKPCPTCAPQTGVLGIENGKSAVFFPDPKPTSTSTPIVIANAQGWNLIGNEELLSSAVLQVQNGNAVDSFVVVTTTMERILAKRTDAAGSAFQVFDIPAERAPTSTQCDFGTQHLGIHTSSKTGRVYVTDRNFCQAIALVPNGSPFTALVNDGGAEDLTLSTSDSSGTFPPDGPTLAPGISIDLRDCNPKCPFLETEEGVAAAFAGVRLANGSNSGATVFQIKGFPDCRYAGEPNFPAALETVCDNAAGVIVDPDHVGHPAAQALNVTALLPPEIKALFDDSGVPPDGLPPMLISRHYRAQERNDFVFEAFFVVTETGVRFRDTFTGEFDVPLLEGVPESLGCEPDPGNLIAVDQITIVSERFSTTDIDGDGDAEHADTLTNVGCINPTLTKPPRLSLLSYNFEPAHATYGPTVLSPAVKSVTEENDAVFARLVQSLYDDLEFVRREKACKQVDSLPIGGPAPLSPSVCSALASKWQNGKIKLDKCVNAAFLPKQSKGDENCKSFVTQLTNYRGALPATTSITDVANRFGEILMRVDVILDVFNKRFLPSIPAAGFCRETDFDSNPLTCPDPWQ